FTNKAAEEMKDRIMQALKNLAKSEDRQLEETLKTEAPQLGNIAISAAQLLTQLLHNFSDFAIMTIDSFIHKVVKAFALEIGLPLNFSIDLSHENIVNYATEKLLASVGRDQFITSIILDFVFSRMRQDKSWDIEKNIKRFEEELFKEKNRNWIHAVHQFDNVFFYHYLKQIENIRDEYVRKLQGLGDRAVKLIDFSGLSIEDFAYKNRGAAGDFYKCAKLRKGGEKKFILGKRFLEEKWVPKSAPDEIKDAVENLLNSGLGSVRDEILQVYDNDRQAALTASYIMDNIYLAGLVGRLKSLIDEYKRKNNVIHISEFNERVNEIVEKSPVPFIYSVLGERYNHYLLDEFQDTSWLQWDNLFPLISNSLAYDYFSMAVGDGKQSIYRWRGGDWAIMERDVEEKIKPPQLKIKHLETNYRSKQAVIEFNNGFFESLSAAYKEAYMDGRQELDKIYGNVTQTPANKYGGFVSLRFIPEKQKGEDPDETIFEKVYDTILNCIENKGYALGDIAILVRQNRKGEEVAERLLEKGIPVVSPDSLKLEKIPLIRFFIDIMTFLANPLDKIAAASIVYFLGLRHKEKPMAASAIGQFILLGEQWELNHGLGQFHHRKKYLIRMPVYELVEELIRIFQLDHSLDFDTRGYLQAFLEVVAAYTTEHAVDISSFLDWWEFNSGDLSVIVPEHKPAVKILTIHKSKGLEFPVVIIPYAAWEHKTDDQLWLFSEPRLPIDQTLSLLPMPVNSVKGLEDTYFNEGFKAEKDKVLIDNINLLYVAFTRAVDNLYIITRRKKNDVNAQLLETHALPMLQETDEDCFTMGEELRHTRKEAKETGIFHYSGEQMISNKWYSKIHIRRKAKEFWRFEESYRTERRNWGTLVHQILAKIRTQDDIPTEVKRCFIAGDISAEEKEILLEKMSALFQVPGVAEWFAPDQPGEVFVEAPIMTPRGTVIPDRVIAAPGQTIIIDYKTGEADEKHHFQMIRYRNVLAAMGYKNITCFLLYIETGRIVSVTEPASGFQGEPPPTPRGGALGAPRAGEPTPRGGAAGGTPGTGE
ncbi:MAG: UvrD-helicase domain-containing protein, partial [bacterium]|nr:UvrD-helicase domain-containing protein [bacterium]